MKETEIRNHEHRKESHNLQEYPFIVHTHASTWHDGGVALLLPNGKVVALASERVGDRYKHSWNSRLAYDHLRQRFTDQHLTFEGDGDYFHDQMLGLEDTNHHLYHAASTFYGSGFEEAAVLVVDGQGPEFNGQRASTTLWQGSGNSLSIIEAPYLTEGVFAPQSIGHFYTAIGAMAGMQNLHEEGKTMGLAPYGKPSRFLEFFRQFAFSNEDGSYYVNPEFIFATLGNTFGPVHFGWSPQAHHIQAIWEEFIELRGRPLKLAEEDVSQDDMDIAYAGQVILEEIMLGLARRAKELTGCSKLCLSGGVALNSVANGKIAQSGLFDEVFIFPAAGDDGQAVGKLFYEVKNRQLDLQLRTKNAYYGPEYSDQEILAALSDYQDVFEITKLDEKSLLDATVTLLESGKVIGWFRGGSEIGPRALGHRSILADPRSTEMRDHINFEVKHREWYRPLAPVVLEEAVNDYFNLNQPSPFMLIVADVKLEKRDVIPAVTHVDGTARVQTVSDEQEPRFYQLVKKFGEKTGVPVLLNTSFNGKGEPIVETPADALKTFSQLRLDALVMEDYLITKRE